MNVGLPPHLWVALSNWVSRGFSVIAQIVCLPILSTMLTPAEFAAYAITVSLLAWYQLADFGFGNSVQNRISSCRTTGKDPGGYIAAVGVLSFAILIAATAILAPVSTLLERALFGKLHVPQGGAFVLWMSGGLLIGNALGIVGQKILYALGKGVIANLLMLLNSLGFLGLLWIVAREVAPSQRLLAAVFAYVAPLGLSGILLLLAITLKYGRWRQVGLDLRALGGSAMKFWLFAVLAAAVLNVDYIIMSRLLPAQEIAAYNVLFRVFWIGMALYSGLLSALWPAITEMGARGDGSGIRRHVRLTLGGGLAALALLSCGLAALLPLVLQWVAPGLDIRVSLYTVALFSGYIGLRIWTDTYAVALQALNEVGIFLTAVPFQAGISIALQLVLAPIWGINGILIGLIMSFALTVTWVLPRRLAQLLPPNGGVLAAQPVK